MNIYKVSCYSSCGTYFAAYLQSVTVMAASKDAALILVKAWLAKHGKSFERDEKAWEIDELTTDVTDGVIDWHEDSDY